MSIIESIFRRRRIRIEKLPPYGFDKNDDTYSYKNVLQGCGLGNSTAVLHSAFQNAHIIGRIFQYFVRLFFIASL